MSRTDQSGKKILDLFSPEPGIELCVICGAETRFRRNDPIEILESYVEGCGQLCDPCNYSYSMNVRE